MRTGHDNRRNGEKLRSTLVARMALAGMAFVVPACAPSGGLIDDPLLTAQSIAQIESDGTEREVTSSDVAAGDPIVLGDDDAVILTGAVRGGDDHVLFPFAPDVRGASWRIQQSGTTAALRVAIFDQDMNLLAHFTQTEIVAFEHTLRRDVDVLYVGVAAKGSQLASFRMRVERAVVGRVPAPRPELIWLNFEGAADLTVGDRAHLSFGALSGATLGAEYAGATAELRAAITNTVRAAYADYDVTVLTSDENAYPGGDASVVYFGGDDDSLLALADHVDGYNRRGNQQAVVFVQRFAAYATMKLEPAEFGRMIGNSTAHEIGHLLGLNHVCAADELLDSHCGDAWDLSGPREFGRAALDAEVFPVGNLDAVQLLLDAVGPSQTVNE